MKNLILCLLLGGFISIGHSQIVLKEANIDYVPVSMEIDQVKKSLVLKISESYVGEFQEDPLMFIRDNFNIDQLIKDNKRSKFDSYHVYFEANIGSVKAEFDKNGNLTSTFQHFKNVPLPDDVRLQILQNYKNSKVVNNKHILSTKNWLIDKEFYKVKIRDGNKTRRLRIERNTQGLSLVGL